jgi:hypothetical protein
MISLKMWAFDQFTLELYHNWGFREMFVSPHRFGASSVPERGSAYPHRHFVGSTLRCGAYCETLMIRRPQVRAAVPNLELARIWRKPKTIKPDHPDRSAPTGGATRRAFCLADDGRRVV